MILCAQCSVAASTHAKRSFRVKRLKINFETES
jgi:hypothetical protein